MMTFDLQTIGAVSVLRPVGPVASVEDAAQFVEKSRGLVSSSMGRFVLDASELSYVDSSGLEALVDIAEQLNRYGQVLKMCQISETMAETIRVTQTAESFECFEHVQDAVRSYR